MNTTNTNNSKAQQLQEQRNKQNQLQQSTDAEENTIVDKKLEGPNRPAD